MYYQKVVNTGLPESIPDSALAVEAQWSVQVAGAKRPATLPDWRSPGQSVKGGEAGSGATRSHAQPQGEHGEDCEHPPFDTALGAAPPVKQTDIGPSGPST